MYYIAKSEDGISSQFSKPVYVKLRSVFGPRRIPFFTMYDQLKAKWDDPEYDPGYSFVEEFRALRNILYQSMVSDNAKNIFKASTSDILLLLRKVDAGTAHTTTYKDIAISYGDLIELVAAERDLFLKGMKRGVGYWRYYRNVTNSEEKLLRLKRDDPEAYQTILDQKSIVETVENDIKKKITDDGYAPVRTKRSGQLYWSATTDTGEKVIYYKDKNTGQIKSDLDEVFRDQLKQKQKEEQKSQRVFPDDISELRVIEDTELETEIKNQTPVYVAITDDKAKQGGITRIYPTVEIEGEKVVSEGRFKGIMIDDLINSVGRQIEGVAYNYNPETHLTTRIEMKSDDGIPNLRVEREPYVTLDQNGNLFLKIPSNMKYTQFRRAVKVISDISLSIERLPKSRNSAFRFQPKDFAAVRQALGSFAMSKAAIEKIKAYFMDLAKFDMAINKENLKHYTADAIGGFKDGVKLLSKQSQSLAWLEARGNNGLCALDVGIGKTLGSIAMMRKMMRENAHEDPDNNGRFLFVCDTTLLGNIPKEAYKFCENPRELLDITDIVSYNKFTRERKKDTEYGQDYIAVFFDEAQKFKNPTAGVTRAALTLNHPRKILLTASPMTRNPIEVFSLAAVANNIDLNTTEGRAAVREFKNKYCETVGGRIVGVKQDPITLREFRVWIKQNLFYADKKDVEEVALPSIQTSTRTVTMDSRIEKRYRETASKISDVLGALVVKYKDRSWDDPEAKRKDLEAFRIRFAGILRRLSDLGNTPEIFEDEFTPEEKSLGKVTNPKIEETIKIIDEQIDGGSRTVLHTDAPSYAELVGPTLSARYAMKKVAVCFPSQIDIYKNGSVMKSYRPKEYTDNTGRVYTKDEWKMYVISRVICPDPDVVACVLTSTYAIGQDLQSFDTTINLDRDTWNAETMKQRRGRVWRQGQDRSVKEYTLDAVYNETTDTKDSTLDQIRRWMQELEEELFDSVVIESQTVALGKEIREMEWISSSYTGLYRKLLELSMSPNPARIGQTEEIL